MYLLASITQCLSVCACWSGCDPAEETIVACIVVCVCGCLYVTRVITYLDFLEAFFGWAFVALHKTV
jgi:hypothetical protein